MEEPTAARLLPVPRSGALRDGVLRLALLVPLLVAACSSDTEQQAAAPSPSAPAATTSAATASSPAARPSSSTLAPVDEPPLGCPAAVPAPGADPQVPAPPSTATDGRLVPDADPVEALVCRYRPAGPDGAQLAGQELLTTGLARVRLDLDVPAGGRPPCPASPAPVPHLVRLTYADGDLWLAAAQGCAGAGNGEFTTAAPVADRIAEAYRTGAWPATTDPPAA